MALSALTRGQRLVVALWGATAGDGERWLRAHSLARPGGVAQQREPALLSAEPTARGSGGRPPEDTADNGEVGEAAADEGGDLRLRRRSRQPGGPGGRPPGKILR